MLSAVAISYGEKLRKRLEFLSRFLRSDPLDFEALELPEGMPVGRLLFVDYLSLHDMREWAIRGELTRLVLCEGVHVNAYRIVTDVKVEEEGYGRRAMIQPYLVSKI